MRIGCTGHQGLDLATRRLVTADLAQMIVNATRGAKAFVGTCSLAEGADQIFALLVLAAGGSLDVVLPSQGYAATFSAPHGRSSYEALLSLASETRTLTFDRPSEEAFLAAGQAVVDECDLLLAVWDGKPAVGIGGTADVVAYARARGKGLRIAWPAGADRG